ncbi:CLUMA_CG003231, isoform A [Clunio marinus]|uniref:CLUMA_CG003231, isoform A n=1 Tax=Clunio marinus TaxID=568069 RepID=A0A1J1HN64_9DIPT|nr:CLUMA_CG003231, isoform A [Clunio marinus]
MNQEILNVRPKTLQHGRSKKEKEKVKKAEALFVQQEQATTAFPNAPSNEKGNLRFHQMITTSQNLVVKKVCSSDKESFGLYH